MSFRSILQQYWGYPDFRGIQADIIQSIAEGRDTLGLMPTGGGKSITFQVPALAMEGVCIVVTPLIALMKDQVMHLKQRGISAEAIYMGQSRDEVMRILDNAVFGAVKFLYISPERIASELFQHKVRGMKVCFITVDEAHCISQWGYDFRPAYLKIVELRQLVPNVPVLALTATATPKVVDDIQDYLGFAEKNVFRMSFERKNLRYIVRTTENKFNELVHILRSVEGPAIVYTRSRQGTVDVAQALVVEGFTALHYHAGLSNVEKDVRQRSWQEDDTRVMVATNAFGMGIDKADVRTVVHMDMPDSIEAYFQEAGRAGRDEKKAYCVLIYNNSDITQAKKRITESFPEKTFIAEVYEKLAYFLQVGVGSCMGSIFNFNLGIFCKNFKLPLQQTHHALKILELAGYIEYHDELEFKTRVQFTCARHQLYDIRLHPLAEKVMGAILRSYTGVFAELVPVDETTLADHAQLTHQEVLQGLIELSHEHIIKYIPHQKIPCVIYTRGRVDTKQLVINAEVYDNRKRRFVERIDAMVGYATDTQHCRSQYLLSYFGETNSSACQACDHCLKSKTKPADVASQIKAILAQQPCSINELIEQLSFKQSDTVETIRLLLDKQEITYKDQRLFLSRHEL